MCDLCTKHGEGTIWYKNAGNYAGDLLSDLGRRGYIENFLKTTFQEGFETLGRVEAIYRKKGRLPEAVTTAMVVATLAGMLIMNRATEPSVRVLGAVLAFNMALHFLWFFFPWLLHKDPDSFVKEQLLEEEDQRPLDKPGI